VAGHRGPLRGAALILKAALALALALAAAGACGCDHREDAKPSPSPSPAATEAATPTPIAVPSVPNTERNAPKCFAAYETGYEAPPAWGRWRRGKYGAALTGTDELPAIDAPRHPAIGAYDSRDAAVVGYHLLAMKGAGFDGAIVRWHGAGTPSETAIEQLFALARDWDEHHGFAFGLALEVDAADYASEPAATRPAALARDLDRLLTLFGGSPVYQQLEGQPVVALVPRPDPRRPNQPSLSRMELVRVRSLVKRAFKLAYQDAGPQLNGVTDIPYAGLPHLTTDDDGGGYLDWFYAGIASRRGRGEDIPVAMGVAYPGAEASPPIQRTIEGQNTLARTWGHVLAFNQAHADAPITWMRTVSWNDWPGGTEIEPGVERETADYEEAARWNQRYSGVTNAPTEALVVAKAYMQARHAGRPEAEFAKVLDLFAAGDVAGAAQALGPR
jgi:hypothetical protein